MLRMSCMAHIPTATPVAANRGYTYTRYTITAAVIDRSVKQTHKFRKKVQKKKQNRRNIGRSRSESEAHLGPHPAARHR